MQGYRRLMEKFNFFENFKYLMMGGHDEKGKNFGKSKKNRISIRIRRV